MGFEDLASLLDHNNLRRNTLRVWVNIMYYTVGLTNLEQGDELGSTFGFHEVRLFYPAVTDLGLRTGSGTRNEVGLTEQPTSTLQIRFINNQQSGSPIH